jgi:hypothetical protein
MARSVLVICAALVGFAASGPGAWAFTIVNQSNIADGGSRAMMTDPDNAYKAQSQANGQAGLFNSQLPGYGGYGAFDYSQESLHRDGMPVFPGEDNHLTPGANAGVLNYGAIPGRKNW